METALAAAWPVQWIEDCGEFELRASRENSNRGNCVRVVAADPDIATMIRAARPFFERHRRPLQIAVSEPLTVVDRELAAMGLGVVNPSLFMTRPIPHIADSPTPDHVRVQAYAWPSPTWLAAWSRCAELGSSEAVQFSIVRKMRDRTYFVSLHDEDGTPLAVGSFMCHGRWRCFGNLATQMEARRKGLGSLVLELLTAHRIPSVDYDVLQVDRHNSAVELYQRHGFRTEHGYHYRRETGDADSVASQREAPDGA